MQVALGEAAKSVILKDVLQGSRNSVNTMIMIVHCNREQSEIEKLQY